jgi:hypothetical protein
MTKADYFESSVRPTRAAGWWCDLRAQLHMWMYNTRPGPAAASVRGIAFESIGYH